MLTIFFLGFSSGLPSPLIFFNLSVWLKDEGFSYTDIGLFGLVGTAYAINFLWAPLIDKLSLGPLTRSLGRRRSWALISQIALMCSICSMGFLGPNYGIFVFACSAVMVAFFSATQDIVIDAYRIEILKPNEYAAGSAMAVFGWQIGGAIVGGAGGLYLVEFFDWQTAYMFIAIFVLVGIVTTLICQEPEPSHTDISLSQKKPAAYREVTSSAFHHATKIVLKPIQIFALAPFMDFIHRLGRTTFLIFTFILIYKLGEAMLGRMSGVFYRELGFGYTEIADVAKLYGVSALIIGGIAGGILTRRLGLLKSLFVSGVLMAATNLAYSWLAIRGHDFPTFAFAVISDHLTAGMATTTFVAYLSSLCRSSYTATQYAFLASTGNFARITYASASGFVLDALGGSWTIFFIATAAATIPGLLLILWMTWHRPFREKVSSD